MSEQTPVGPVEDTAVQLPPPSVPAGWYPTPDGSSRYWDGVAWTDLPPVDSSASDAVDGDRPRRKKTRKGAFVAAAIVLVLALGGGTAWKLSSDHAASVQAAAVAAAKHKAEVKHHEAELAAEAAKEAKEAKEAAERADRDATVKEIEASVKTMAVKDASEGVIDGPILSVSCSPLGGGSTDDLTQQTTVFQCFAADKNNTDGSQSGNYFHSTMNWTAGTYTYGLGDASS